VQITDFKAPIEAWSAVEKYFRTIKMELVDEGAEELYTYHDDF
jgi:hypothetical protein